MVMTYFCGHELPTYLIHTNLVLITKKEDVKTFGDLRPISQSKLNYKIILWLLHERMLRVDEFNNYKIHYIHQTILKQYKTQ